MRAPGRQAQRQSRMPGREATIPLDTGAGPLTTAAGQNYSALLLLRLNAHFPHAVIAADQQNVGRAISKETDRDDARNTIDPVFHLDRI